jgi:O-glycosyl hydrolase
MKMIKEFIPKNKYQVLKYEQIEEAVYKHDGKYVTALSFQQEPEYDEGNDSANISQYPLEDLLERFSVYISDFFKEMNTADSTICYLEFTGFSLDDIHKLRDIIGKHVYNKKIRKNNKDYIELVIE